MTDAEFLDEMARKSNVLSTNAGVRMTPEERDRLVALARARQWQRCDTHGGFDPNRAVGCPECVRDLREEVRALTVGKETALEWNRLACAQRDRLEREKERLRHEVVALRTNVNAMGEELLEWEQGKRRPLE